LHSLLLPPVLRRRSKRGHGRWATVEATRACASSPRSRLVIRRGSLTAAAGAVRERLWSWIILHVASRHQHEQLPAAAVGCRGGHRLDSD
jgi:hypothetical protein